ncbi:hypothetical protein [Streptomyces sp. DH24]|uniref:hypothetical protein n=1 Tax=Streptomyces sp. DH24 TaxID=3040123 RepID=UPI002441805E|nr:hypothetical protein [Streptomyces sp. DH24]MDG9717039.1 hypothetical protein [Streptomyces sp. DH24]
MIRFPPPLTFPNEQSLVPFVTLRRGEEAAPANLHILRQRDGSRLRLFYGDEDPRDRPVRGILWARCGFSRDGDGMPAGEPLWKFMHPYRQMATMLAGRCQVCTRPARTPLGYLFLTGPKDRHPAQPLLTGQPPVCVRHVHTTAKLCPHMAGDPVVCLADRAPLHGVIGSVYGRGPDGAVTPVSAPPEPVTFNDPRAPLLLGSQLVRRLSSFRVLDLDGLRQLLATGHDGATRIPAPHGT